LTGQGGHSTILAPVRKTAPNRIREKQRAKNSKMAEQYESLRAVRRLIPKQAATASVYRDEQRLAYGILTNISVSGACIVTDSRLIPGSDVNLRLSFYQQPTLIETGARIVWNRQGSGQDKGFEGLQLHGVRFTHTASSHRGRLIEVLDTGAFETVYTPTATEFERLQNELGAVLDELGTKISKTIGNHKHDG
jgi:hypothetical protein